MENVSLGVCHGPFEIFAILCQIIYFRDLGMKISCPGDPGHGSRFIENTAASKFRYLIDRFLDLRQQEKNKLEANPHFTLGDVTSVNLTKVEVC